MGNKRVTLLKRRVYSEEFKKARVREYEKGDYTVNELSRLYTVSFQSLYRWIYQYSHYNKKGIIVVEMEESSEKKVKELEKRIRELERAVGQKQLNIDYLEKMIELAKEEFGIDVKKNSGTPQSDGSKSTEKQ